MTTWTHTETQRYYSTFTVTLAGTMAREMKDEMDNDRDMKHAMAPGPAGSMMKKPVADLLFILSADMV